MERYVQQQYDDKSSFVMILTEYLSGEYPAVSSKQNLSRCVNSNLAQGFDQQTSGSTTQRFLCRTSPDIAYPTPPSSTESSDQLHQPVDTQVMPSSRNFVMDPKSSGHRVPPNLGAAAGSSHMPIHPMQFDSAPLHAHHWISGSIPHKPLCNPPICSSVNMMNQNPIGASNYFRVSDALPSQNVLHSTNPLHTVNTLAPTKALLAPNRFPLANSFPPPYPPFPPYLPPFNNLLPSNNLCPSNHLVPSHNWASSNNLPPPNNLPLPNNLPSSNILFPSNSSPPSNSSSTNNREVFKKQRKPRAYFADWQLDVLEKSFHISKVPDMTTRVQLSKTLGYPEIKIRTWFKNRRARLKRTENLPQEHIEPIELIGNQNQQLVAKSDGDRNDQEL